MKFSEVAAAKHNLGSALSTVLRHSGFLTPPSYAHASCSVFTFYGPHLQVARQTARAKSQTHTVSSPRSRLFNGWFFRAWPVAMSSHVNSPPLSSTCQRCHRIRIQTNIQRQPVPGPASTRMGRPNGVDNVWSVSTVIRFGNLWAV